jgi:tight adherence protein C
MSIVLAMQDQIAGLAERAFPGRMEAYYAYLNQVLAEAGSPPVTARRLAGLQGLSGFVFPFMWSYIFYYMGGGFRFLVTGPQAVVTCALLFFIGLAFPVLNIREKAKKRKEAITKALPDMIDLLTVCVEAGLDFIASLHVVVENQPPGPLRDEFGRFLKQLEMGVLRTDALQQLSLRVNAPDLNSVCAVLIQASRLGSPLGHVLRMQSDLLRTRRLQRAEKKASEATVKLLAPLALCTFPAVFIAILGPVVYNLMLAVSR